MGRDDSSKRKAKKRHHSHHSRHDESDSEDDESSMTTSSSDSDTASSSAESSDTSTSEEERRRRARKKARRSSEGEDRKHGKAAKRKQKKRKSKDKKPKKPRKMDIDKISMDDYFLRSAEFRTWLSKERGTFFSDLSSEESRKLFKKFASKWNSGILNKLYYKGIQSSAVSHTAQSNHQWKLSSKVDSGDLKTLRDNVSSWSSSKDNFDFGSDSRAGSSRSAGSQPSAAEPVRVIGPSRGPVGDTGRHGSVFEREERRGAERDHVKRGRKELRKQQELVLDELLPKATGREARVEKKRVQAERRREREVSPDFDDSKVYGSSTNSIRDKVKAQQEHRVNRAHAAVQKISDYQAKEKARVEAIMQMAKANKKEGALW